MQRYFSNKQDGNSFILNNDDLYHIRKVMRMTNGEKIEVVYNNELYICSIENVNTDIKINKINKLEEKVSNKLEISIAVPLVKEQKLDLILQKSTELGVDKIIIYEAERSVIKINIDKENNKLQRWQKICKEASEQSKRTDIPSVIGICKLNDLINYDGQKIVCSTKKSVNNIKFFLQNNIDCDKLFIVIGPEGGLSEREELFLTNNKFIPLSLGNRILRVETVPLFLLSVINYNLME